MRAALKDGKYFGKKTEGRFYLTMNTQAASGPSTQKLVERPSTIEEELDDTEDSTGYEEIPKFKLDGDSAPLRNVMTNSRMLNLSRVSTGNSSLNQVASGLLRYDSSRKIFRPATIRNGLRRRAIFKNGECNILHARIATRGIRFIFDIFTSLVDIQWRWTITIFALTYFISWLTFALIWWLIVFTHGDLEDEHLPHKQGESKWTPCILNIYNYTSCYLYSLETQYTIGYGLRVITEECPQAIFIMGVQSIVGMMIDAFAVGIIFAKMTRPKLRTQTLLFSKTGVINQRDGQLCLMFRAADMRKTHLIGAIVRAQLLRPRKTKEGEVLNSYQIELDVKVDSAEGTLLMIWPLTIVHKIDEESPLYHLTPNDFHNDRFEIMVLLEGTVESTGQTTQARSSYVSNEILWGYRFEPVVSYNKVNHCYEVDYAGFDNTFPVDTPLCSGAQLSAVKRREEDSEEAEPEKRPELPSEENLLRPLPPIPVDRNKRQYQRRTPFPDYPESYGESTLLDFNSGYV